MDVTQILAELDQEIARLHHVRSLLAGVAAPAADKPKRGRPKGSGTKAASTPAKKTGKRQLSPEGRKAIADAMKRRWAERKKAQG